MATLIGMDTFTDLRGALVSTGDRLPFFAKRAFFIHSVPAQAVRGGHSHRKNRQALICVSGSCEVFVGGPKERVFLLDRRDQCLLLEPGDWHEMRNFSPDAILLVLASEGFDAEDYVSERPDDSI